MSRFLRERSHSLQSESEEQEQIRLFAESPEPDLEKMNSYGLGDDNHCIHPSTSIVKNIRIDRPVLSLGVLTGYNHTRSTLRDKIRSTLAQKCKFSPLGCLYSLFPILYWLPRYNFRKDLTFDLIAGFTIAVMQIPQGMAYALLGNLPPIIGLYMSFFPVIIYAIMGTSRHVSVGTFAVICLMTGKVAYQRLEHYNGDFSTMTDDDDNIMNYTKFEDVALNHTSYTIVEVAAALSLCVGIWQIIFGVLHTGALSLLLSSELVSGFTTGAAFHVFTSQVRTILGLRLARRTGLFKIILTYVDVFTHIQSCNLAAVVMSLVTLAVLIIYNELLRPIVSKRVKFPIPVELLCIIVGTVASRQWDFREMYSISIVHTIPTGLKAPTLPPLEILPDLITDGLLIGVVAFAISISMVKIFATKHGYEISPNQELLAHGASNAIGSLFSCAPICVSLSRSVIQESIGGRSQLVGLFSSGLIVIVLLWIGPFFETLPNCVLSAIIIVALKGMFLQIFDLKKAWNMSRLNGLIWIITAVSTVVLEVEYGLGIGLFLSVLVLIWRSNAPTINVLGSFSNFDIYADISNPQVKEMSKIKIIKYTGSLNFVTIDYFTNKLQKIVPLRNGDASEVQRKNSILSIVKSVSEHVSLGNKDTFADSTQEEEQIDYIILDMASVSSVDPAAVKNVHQLYKKYQDLSIQVLFAGCTAPVVKVFADCQVLKAIGLGNFFPSIHDAISYANSLSFVTH